MTSGCAFCGDTCPNPVLADYGTCFVVEPLAPVIPGHLLVIPRVHVATALGSPVVAGMAVEVAAHHASHAGVGACDLIISDGQAATQTVGHLHVHIVPRRPGDGLQLPWTTPPPARGGGG